MSHRPVEFKNQRNHRMNNSRWSPQWSADAPNAKGLVCPRNLKAPVRFAHGGRLDRRNFVMNNIYPVCGNNHRSRMRPTARLEWEVHCMRIGLDNWCKRAV